MIAKRITKPRIQKQSSNMQKPIVVTRSSFDALEVKDIKNTDDRIEAETGVVIATTLPPIAPSSTTKDKGKKVALADISNLPKAKTTILNHQAKSLSTKQPTMQNPKPTTSKSKHMPNLTLSPSSPNPKPTSPMQTKLQNPPRKNVTGPNKHHSRLLTFTLGDFMDFKNNPISVETTVPLPTILNPKTNSVVGKPSKQADPKPGLSPASPNDIDLAIVSKENVISGRLPELPAPVMDDVMGEYESSIGMEHDSKNGMNDEDNAQSSVNIRVLKAKYNFDYSIFFPPTAPNSCTSLWRLIVANWGDMASNVAWIVGNDKSTLFWEHIWLPGSSSPLLDLVISDPPSSTRFKPIADFVDTNGAWMWHKFATHLSELTVQLVAATLPPNSAMEDDEAYWNPSPSGNFSLRTAYAHLNDTDFTLPRLPWSLVWKWIGPQRIKSFFWLLLNRGVLSNAERNRRHLTDVDRYHLCRVESESYFHLLRDCTAVKDIWLQIVPIRFQAFFFNPSISFVDWCFGNLKEDSQVGNKQLRVVFWSCPLPGFVKFNCDASVTGALSSAFGGGLIRNSSGHWVGGFVSNLGRCPILRAEIWSFFHSLEYALSINARNILIESDNAIAVDMINDVASPSASCLSLVRQIRQLLNAFDSSHLSHIHREGNFVADSLSHHAYTFDPGVHYLSEPPDCIASWLFHDLVGVTYFR
ncbi:hypothetical protein K2173_005337 [Erythroxylum novogranatense]|uniref:RNase H type-1 domain-containing protein n=1 Tax=Erythroxylum novogranatense TaxID=1862640 RepID=A0AAV8TJY2_9ROSI|nr:hypothetical protein K2173_005337 [Erythroxylum novogranatense]